MDPKDPMITIWLAVTDSDDENGCVRIIPGTQHDDWHEQVEGNRGNDVVFGRTIPGYRTPGQEERAVSVILKVRAAAPFLHVDVSWLSLTAAAALAATGGGCLCAFVALGARFRGKHIRSPAVWPDHFIYAGHISARCRGAARVRRVRSLADCGVGPSFHHFQTTINFHLDCS